MPELPEVETYRRDLDRALVGRTFRSAVCNWPRQLPVNTPEELSARIAGQRVTGVARHGKVLRIALEARPKSPLRPKGPAGPSMARSEAGGVPRGHMTADATTPGPRPAGTECQGRFSAGFLERDWLLVHLGMSGRLSCVPVATPVNPHAHVVFVLDGDEELRFHDPRKFGRIRLVADADAELAGLGPDALGAELTEGEFTARLLGRARQLKPLLLDQSFVAGIGNIYADESLWAAKLHPLSLANRVRRREAAELYGAMRSVLTRSVEARGTTFTPAGYRDFWGEPGEMVSELQVFRRTGQPCPRCGALIERLVAGGRSTHVCPRCQRIRR